MILMTSLVTQLPARRTDLVIQQLGPGGRYVVKDPSRGEYFELGEQEHFLLAKLDGKHDAETIRAAFEARFDGPLNASDLNTFVRLATERGLVEESQSGMPNASQKRYSASTRNGAVQPSTQSLLYWRKSLFDPDSLFGWLEPKIRFFWTRTFLALSAGLILLAAVVAWNSQEAVAASFASALRWETALLAWLVTMILVTLHEFSHGLTCKHYGGEVREIGFLLMFFVPCFYCNVSDAWLFPDKSNRLKVTLAGGYFELFVWALAVFVWRVTLPGTIVNYVAFVVVSVSGIQSFFNLNPLIKLDGYYLLSDWVELPNLHRRGITRAMGYLNWLLWGAPKPVSEAKGGFLLAYGLLSWCFSGCLVSLLIAGMLTRGWSFVGPLAAILAVPVGLVAARAFLGDLLGREFRTMIWQRHKRKFFWLASLGTLVIGSLLVHCWDYANGEFEVRAQTHAQLRAPLAGFLKAVYYSEGQQVAAGNVVAALEIPDLASRTARKKAELSEADARLRLLRAGTRREEIAQQRSRVLATEAWRNIAAENLERQQRILQHDLVRFDKMLAEHEAIRDFTEQTLDTLENLRRSKVVSNEDYLDARKSYLVARANYERITAERAGRLAQGTMLAQSELAEREKELAVEQSLLVLLEAGSRPEEVQAAEASKARLDEELKYLQQLKQRTVVISPVCGTIATAELKDKIGHYFREGDLICEVEDPATLEVVIQVDEDQGDGVLPGQSVRLKARARPFQVFTVNVQRVAPRANEGELQSTVNVYCRLTEAADLLRSGMTGHARIQRGRGPIAVVAARHCLRYVRTEFWW